MKSQKKKPAVPAKQQGEKKPTAPTANQRQDRAAEDANQSEYLLTFPAPANPKLLWARWGMANGNDERARHLVSFGRSLLNEMFDAVLRWGEVAVMLDLEGVADGQNDWEETLAEIDGAMHSMRDTIIHAKNFGPVLPTA